MAGCSALGCAIASLLVLAPAGAQRRVAGPVTVQPLFGEGTLLADSWSPVLIEVENRTRGDQHGELLVSVSDHAATVMRRQLPLDVPRGATRRAIVNVFTGETGSVVRVAFDVGDRQIGVSQISVGYQPSGRSLVVLGDPPRLRGALLDLEVAEPDGTTGVPRIVRFPAGTVRFDPATGDPLLPEAPAAWSSVKLLVASAPILTRVGEAQRSAIEDWLRAGGRMLVFPRAEADLRQPWLASLTGGAISTDAPLAPPSGLVPAGGVRFGFACTGEQRVEAFGCSAPFGQGRVFVAAYDGTTPAAIESRAPRELVSAVIAAPETSPSVLPFARGRTSLGREYWHDAGSFGSLRAALDPNEGFRPALGLVALVLLIYVIVVGPLNFRWVRRRNRPTLALLTTPAAAMACVLLLLFVGYLGKGVTMRYRRVELIETMEGQARAASRRYTGLFSTRPGTFELPGGDDRNMLRRIGGGAQLGPVHRIENDVETLVDFRAGLWETTFLREDRIVDLGGPISFERDGRRLASVRNDSTTPLEGAIVIDQNGAIYLVGDVPAGSRADIARSSVAMLSRHTMLGPGSEGAETIARHTGYAGDEDEAMRVRGLIHLLGARFVPDIAPVLYARLPASATSIGDVFSREIDQRWLRIRPALPGSTVERVAERRADPYAVDPYSVGVGDVVIDAATDTGGSVGAGDGGVP